MSVITGLREIQSQRHQRDPDLQGDGALEIGGDRDLIGFYGWWELGGDRSWQATIPEDICSFRA
jgi:hypothetical protein